MAPGQRRKKEERPIPTNTRRSLRSIRSSATIDVRETAIREKTELLQRMSKNSAFVVGNKRKAHELHETDSQEESDSLKKKRSENSKRGHTDAHDISKRRSVNKTTKGTSNGAVRKELVGPKSVKRGKREPAGKKKNVSVTSVPKKVRNNCSDVVGIEKLSDSDSEAELLPVVRSVNDPVKENNLSSDSEASEWEEVEEGAYTEDREPVIPKEGVQITLEAPNILNKQSKKKQFDIEGYYRREVNRFKKDIQENLHKVNLLCLLARGFYLNSMSSIDALRGHALSIIKPELLSTVSRKADCNILKKILYWFRSEKKLVLSLSFNSAITENLIENCYGSKKVEDSEVYVVMLIIILRILGFDARLVLSLQPVTLKPEDLMKAPSIKTDGKKKGDKDSASCSTSGIVAPPCTSKEAGPNETGKPPKTQKRSSAIKRQSRKSVGSYDSDSETDKIIKKKKKSASSQKSKPKHSKEAAVGNDAWIEVYLQTSKKWICIDCIVGNVDCFMEMEGRASKPLKYVVTFDNNNRVKDVTKRYAENWVSCTRKMRVDEEWWEETLAAYRGKPDQRDENEDKAILNAQISRPLPATVSEYKNHPLYVLKRHLLKFEALYPPNPAPVGFVKSEPVYSRDCVHTLRSRETWLKEAKMVRLNEVPYKLVKARAKLNKTLGLKETGLPLEVFGYWQVEDYEPPVAQNGKVPRNEYGNVELYKPCMLPKGTVHLPAMNGLNRVAKKLGIDCAPAMIGFDYHKSGCHPLFDGWVVCEQFVETLLDAVNEQEEISSKKAEEKKQKRVWSNWRRLIRCLLIRERLHTRYMLSEDPSTSTHNIFSGDNMDSE